MQTLAQSGMNRNWIYEAIVSTYRHDRPHAAPIGIWTDDFVTLQMEIYKNTQTIANILQVKEFAVNLVADLTLFYESLFDKARIVFGKSLRVNAPIIRNASATVECRILNVVEQRRTFRLQSTPVHIQTSGPLELINRAKALALESLVLATKAAYLPESKVEETLRENRRVIGKVAPGSQYENILEMLFERMEMGHEW